MNLKTVGLGLLCGASLCGGLTSSQSASVESTTAAVPGFDPARPTRSGFVMTFHDEFNGPGLDPKNWLTAYPWGPNTTINGELQYYPNIQDPQNPVGANPFGFANGTLTISAFPWRYGQLNYVSGVITTYKKFSQTYGYFEARMRLPSGKGLWPTFWLMPENNTWPPELDIMEMTGQNTKLLMTTEHDNVNGRNVPHACYVGTSDMAADFHTYGLMWTATDLIWYFDGKPVCHHVTTASLHVPMYILLNLAIGNGGWTGMPDAGTLWPQTLQVQYVRAYARESMQTCGVCSESGRF
jgi:beta-glucanase (GH16 family)